MVFDVFRRSKDRGKCGQECILLFGQGESYQPWSLVKAKSTGTKVVLYHRRDRARVYEYLNRSHPNVRLTDPSQSSASNTQESLIERAQAAVITIKHRLRMA